MNVDIYSDGASKGNPGHGGWGAVLLCKGQKKEIYGYGGKEVTNNQMEILAALKGLEALKTNCDVTLYSDSNYVVQGINSWLDSWKKKNWIGANKKPIANKDLWLELDKQLSVHSVKAIHVSAHTGIEYNELCDQLANRAIQEELCK